MKSSDAPDQIDCASTTLGHLRDLSDFCQHWPVLKRLITDEELVGSGVGTDSDTYRMIVWMRALADRVCPGERF